MADKDGDGPSLELPSLGFGRKQRRKRGAVEDDAPAEPATEDHTARIPEDHTARIPSVPEAAPAAPPLFADEVGGAPTQAEAPTRTDTGPVAGAADDETAPREFRLPQIGGMASALLTGAVAGLLLVGLTSAGFRLCEVVRGTSSCGDPGFLLLAAILAAVVLLGSAVLRAFSLPDPGSTSFLAVGLLAVTALLFLVDVLFNWWMIIVVPVLSMLCFALSHWVTTVFVDTDE